MKDLICVVTGASSGIGKHISIELSSIAKHIYIIARDIKKLECVHDEIIKNQCECTIVPVDLREENSVENLAQQISKKNKFINALILSAGSIDALSPIDSIDLQKFKDILKLNYISNFRMIKNFHPLLKSTNNANLAVISSQIDNSKKQYWGIYQPIMSALNELTITYAKENYRSKIKANVFCPKAVRTKFRDIIMPGENKDALPTPEYIAKKIIKHILTSEESGKIIQIS